MIPKEIKILFVYQSIEIPLDQVKVFHTLREYDSDISILFSNSASHKNGFLERIFNKVKFPLDTGGLNKKIIDYVHNSKPDLVFIVKGNLIRPKTLRFLKNKNIKIVSWSLDDMYAWHNRSVYYTLGLKIYDLVVTSKTYNCNKNELPSLGAKVLYQPQSYYPEIQPYTPECQKSEFAHDVLFVGTFEEDRFRRLLYLAETGIQVHIYGWAKKYAISPHKNLIFHENHLYGSDFTQSFKCSKISLNFLRKKNRDLHTSRSIEIPWSGGFMLAERTQEHSDLFEEGKEAEYFSTNEELVSKIKFYLQNDELRKQIAENGHKKCITGGYGIDERVSIIITKIFNNGN